MKASILDLRMRMGDILRAIERNELVTIMYRGKEKAVLMPVSRNGAQTKVENHKAFGMWKDREEMRDPSEYVSSMRKGRPFDF